MAKFFNNVMIRLYYISQIADQYTFRQYQRDYERSKVTQTLYSIFKKDTLKKMTKREKNRYRRLIKDKLFKDRYPLSRISRRYIKNLNNSKLRAEYIEGYNNRKRVDKEFNMFNYNLISLDGTSKLYFHNLFIDMKSISKSAIINKDTKWVFPDTKNQTFKKFSYVRENFNKIIDDKYIINMM